MRQAFALLVAAVLVTIGVFLPVPDEPTAPETVVSVYPGTATGVGFCPTWFTDEFTQSHLAFGVAEGVDLEVAFQADDEVVVVESSRGSAGTVTADPLLAQGFVPALVERRSGDAVAGGVVTIGEGLLGVSSCARWPATRWVVGVGGTIADEETTLLFHNPTAQAATISVEAYSEQGLEIGEGLGSITVPPQGSVQHEVTGDLRLRDRLVFIVVDPLGAVVPALVHHNGGTDRAVTVGVPESTDPDRSEWFFPATGGGPAELVLVNAESFEVAVEVDLFRPEGAEIGIETLLLPPRSSEAFTFDGGPAIRVRADAPVGAAVRTEPEAGIGITMGVAVETERWMVVGPGLDGGQPTLEILNTAPEAVTVTYRVLGPGGATSGRSITVPGASAFGQELRIDNAAGVLVEATGPVTVGWWSVVGGGLGVGQGIPLD